VTSGNHEPDGPAYRPGVCNINPREIAHRRRIGIVGVGIAVALAIVLVAIGAPPIARGLVLFPLWGGIVSLEQARRRFCVAFAYGGIRSADASDATERVADPADSATDRTTARRMVASSGVIAAVLTAILVIVPV